MSAVEQSPSGTARVSRAIRKRLKYGTVHEQKRALTVCVSRAYPDSRGPGRDGLQGLSAYVILSNPGNFADIKLVERIKYIANSVTSDAGVRRKLMLILLSWRRHFTHDPSMVYVTSLYSQCGGVDRVAPVQTVGRGAPHGEHSTALHPDVGSGLTHNINSVRRFANARA